MGGLQSRSSVYALKIGGFDGNVCARKEYHQQAAVRHVNLKMDLLRIATDNCL